MQAFTKCAADVDPVIIASIPDIQQCIAALKEDFRVSAEYSPETGKFVIEGSMEQMSCAEVRLHEIYYEQLEIQRHQLRRLSSHSSRHRDPAQHGGVADEHYHRRPDDHYHHGPDDHYHHGQAGSDDHYHHGPAGPDDHYHHVDDYHHGPTDHYHHGPAEPDDHYQHVDHYHHVDHYQHGPAAVACPHHYQTTSHERKYMLFIYV